MQIELNIEHINVSAHNLQILNDVSLKLRSGDFLALLGGNGSGKTTLLRTVMGLIKPERGSVSLRINTETYFDYRVIKRHIAYIPQSLNIDSQRPFNVQDVVSMGRYVHKRLGQPLSTDDWHMARKAMSDVDILHLADRPVGSLSGGERQKVHIARALCQEANILLMDEPTSNLDLGAQHEYLDMIEHIHAHSDIAIVVVMHDLQALPERCQRAVIIENGKKAFDGAFKDVFAPEQLALIYKHRTKRVLEELLKDVNSRRSSV